MAADPHDILRQHFGHDAFRGRQREAIDHVLTGGHALVIMPTGMGKSLCYQVPALAMPASAGLTLVISPMIALMKDQVDALRAKGIDAAFINSSLSRAERESRMVDVAQGRYRLLYVTPERFRKADFVDIITRRGVGLLAVDEAHCISAWGHDFRPDYTRLGEIRNTLANPTTIALTATATPDVQRDILAQLRLAPADVRQIHEGIDRPNLSLDVVDLHGDDAKLDAIVEAVEQPGGPGIVYFALIKTLERFGDLLDRKRVDHLQYHGKLDARDRRRVQNAFMQSDADDKPVVLATNAFGMGIDKENIRFVLHAEVPSSMEAYYQEIGRAGRDGKPSVCTLLYDQNDLLTQMEFIKWSNPDADFYRRVHHMLEHDMEKVHAFGLSHLREQLLYKHRTDFRLETTLSMLERYGVVENLSRPGELELVADLPADLIDPDRIEAKRLADQQKLLTMVEYTKCEGDRKAFIHRYFGLDSEV